MEEGGKEGGQRRIRVPELDLAGKKELMERGIQETFSDNAQVFMLMEKRDEAMIQEEILGRYTHEYVYDIPFKNKNGKETCGIKGCKYDGKIPHTHVQGLSYSGVKEAARLMGAIDTRLTEPEMVEIKGRSFWKVGCKAVDLKTGRSTMKWKLQSVMKDMGEGKEMENEFAYEISQSKAERNAISALLPQNVIRAWIKDYIAGKEDFDPKILGDSRKALPVQKAAEAEATDNGGGSDAGNSICDTPCSRCGKEISYNEKAYSEKWFKKALCRECQNALRKPR